MRSLTTRIVPFLAALAAAMPATAVAQAPSGGAEAPSLEPSPFRLSGGGNALLGKKVRFRGAVEPRLAGLARELVLTSDSVASHAGAFAGGPGAVVAIGTGAVAVGLGPRGLVLVDGIGFWLGDDGSGCWIGRLALRHVLETPPALAEGLSTEEAELVGWCLSPARRDRPATAALVADRLDRLARAA